MAFIEDPEISVEVTVTRRLLVGDRSWNINVNTATGRLEFTIPSQAEEPMSAKELQVLMGTLDQLPLLTSMILKPQKPDEVAA